MNVLLDTHALLWFLNGDNELSEKSRKAIEEINNDKFISIVSLWEIAIKISLKKLEFKKGFKNIYHLIEKNGFNILHISFEHTLIVSSLEFIHRDPFDRLLVAQAIHEKMIIITKDSNITKYHVKTLW
jgi:Uncharacterized protein conserved in bacteria